jgi:antitoxin (DNA-binding transcriptional repressor) of toxin-antitoxin stability system
MKTISIREARQALSNLSSLLGKEDELIITRHGKPVARLVRFRPSKSIPSHRTLRESMPKLREGSETLIREDRDAR